MFEYRVLWSLVLVACLCACGNGTAEPAVSSFRAPPSAAVDRSDPGSVAVAFTLAMASQDYAAATPLFDPAKRGILSALALGAQSASAGATGKLSSGRQRISGDSGSVALVGQLCRNGSGGTSSSAQTPDCIDNLDPDTLSPLFTVQVVRVEGQWYATFVAPTVTGTTANPPT